MYELSAGTKHFLEHLRSIKGPHLFSVLGKDFIITPNVFLPGPTTEFIIENIDFQKGEEVLEIGTGHAIIPIFAALRGAKRAVATDISRYAIACSLLNIEKHALGEKIDVREGDLFSVLDEKEKFDKIIFHAPHHGAKPRDVVEMAVTDEDYGTLRRFIGEARGHLKENGKIYIGFSDSGDTKLVEKLIEDNGYKAKVRKQRRGDFSRLLYELRA